MIRRPPRPTLSSSSAASDVYKRQVHGLVEKWNIDISSIQNELNQGDINSDGSYGLCGSVISKKFPKVNLRQDSPQANIEGSNVQIAQTFITYNKFSQIETIETPEGEVSKMLYYPENDPEGDGLNILTGTNPNGQPYDGTTGGLLKEVIADYAHTARYRGTESPKAIRTKIGYDIYGNIAWTIDPRLSLIHI
eukprot:TRINITY_DN7340_c0_g2_i1.p2 TRINITY_DN7340_c0_g2~~TRINITY_DN7340_c0_g2_i1.p2  ORF type:complete len:193 (+),score=18.33 TRINITY_DN7340_c0_g2_i1:100-678(+)